MFVSSASPGALIGAAVCLSLVALTVAPAFADAQETQDFQSEYLNDSLDLNFSSLFDRLDEPLPEADWRTFLFLRVSTRGHFEETEDVFIIQVNVVLYR